MSIYKRPGSPYYSYDFIWRGERFRGSTKQTKKYLADCMVGELKTKLREGGVKALRKAPTLREFSTEFIQWVNEAQSLEENTRKVYRNGCRMLLDTKLASMRMDEIENHVVETISFPASNDNANHALRTLRRMFSKAHETKRIATVPKISLRKVWGRSIAMSVPDAQRIAAQMPEGNARDAFQILRATGMRPCEVFAMRWEHLNSEHPVYVNPRGKTKSARRIVPMLNPAPEILARRRMEQGGPVQGWVFPSNAACGHLVTINVTFRKARKAAGLPDEMVLYASRHGALTDLAQVMTLKELMAISGHSDSRVAMSYQHPPTADIQKRLDEAKTTGRIQ